MAIIDTYSLIVPLLKTISKKEEYKLNEIINEVAENTDLTEKELSLTIPNGETLFASKLGTANIYLKKIGFIESPKFMYYKITQKGLDLLDTNPESITEEDLLKYPEFREYKKVFTPREENTKAKSIFEESLKQQINEFKEFKDSRENNLNNKSVHNSKCKDKKSHRKCKKHHHKSFSPAKELTMYADLLERGYLTKIEYELKKKELLSIKYI